MVANSNVSETVRRTSEIDSQITKYGRRRGSAGNVRLCSASEDHLFCALQMYSLSLLLSHLGLLMSFLF